jgi:tetratricopeptide (TPR) repeat protein
LKRYEESAIAFDDSLAVDSRSSYAISGKAAALYRLGKEQEAFKLFHHAIDIDSFNFNGWYNLESFSNKTKDMTRLYFITTDQ